MQINMAEEIIRIPVYSNFGIIGENITEILTAKNKI